MMIATFIFVIVGLLALLSVIVLASGQTTSATVLKNPVQHLRPVDIEAFRNLIAPSEEEFLRRHLQPAEFRKVQRQRLLAAAEYVTGAARNAAILLRFAEGARRSSNAATAETAEKLIAHALRLRLYALHVVPRLYFAAMLPGASFAPVLVAERYELIVRQVVMLGLQYPTQGISAML